VKTERWRRWDTCRLCEQSYHGVVRCALGWACWKTYLGRPETDPDRRMAMGTLGNGLHYANHFEEALAVTEAQLSMERRLGASDEGILFVQGNLALTYQNLGRHEEALQMKRDVYSGYLKLHGEEYEGTLIAASHYASSLVGLRRSSSVKGTTCGRRDRRMFIRARRRCRTRGGATGAAWRQLCGPSWKAPSVRRTRARARRRRRSPGPALTPTSSPTSIITHRGKPCINSLSAKDWQLVKPY